MLIKDALFNMLELGDPNFVLNLKSFLTFWIFLGSMVELKVLDLLKFGTRIKMLYILGFCGSLN